MASLRSEIEFGLKRVLVSFTRCTSCFLHFFFKLGGISTRDTGAACTVDRSRKASAVVQQAMSFGAITVLAAWAGLLRLGRAWMRFSSLRLYGRFGNLISCINDYVEKA